MNQFLDFDQKLYAELRKGSEHAFVTVFERYNRLLYALAYRYFKSGEEAEDAVQYTFMKLWEQRSSFEFQSGIRSLLFTILKNYIMISGNIFGLPSVNYLLKNRKYAA